MEQRLCEESKCGVSRIFSETEKSTVLRSSPVLKPGISGNSASDSRITCQTPEKEEEFLKRKFGDGDIDLKDNFRILADFFDGLNCSLRLLTLCKKSHTFQNISRQVEVLTKRKFLHRHLAQIIYIIPEAVQVDKVLVHDKKTSCMKPDLIINLQFDIVEGHSEKSNTLALRKVFASRLMKFILSHPETSGGNKNSTVPEATLPEPFNQNYLFPQEQLPVASTEFLASSEETKPSTEDSSVYPSISTHSGKPTVPEGERTECSRSFESSAKMNCFVKPLSPQVSNGCSFSESPLIKPNASIVMIETPEQLTPRRSIPSSDVKHQEVVSNKSLSDYKPAKRVLDFSGPECEESVKNVDLNVLGSYENAEGFCTNRKIPLSMALLQKGEDHPSDDDYSRKSQEGSKDNSCLGDLAVVIHNIFKSVNYSSITKEELFHKIIMNSLEITDRRQVEEQTELLSKMVPDWISKKLMPSGDAIYNVKEASSMDLIRAKLACQELS